MNQRDPHKMRPADQVNRHTPAGRLRNRGVSGADRTAKSCSASDPCGSDRVHPGGKNASSRCWVVAETLSGTGRSSVVLDGAEPREFSNLARSSVAANGLIAKELGAVVQECATVGGTCSKDIAMPNGQTKRVAALPVLGPTGHVYAAALWVDDANGDLPGKPHIGTMEWRTNGIVTADPAAAYLLRLPFGELPHGNTIPELLSRFDQWDDRAKFLSMFNLVDPTDQWIGTATTTYDDGTDHQLNFAARASGHGSDRTIHAIVFESATDPTAAFADPRTLAFRQMPILSGHALALVDLPSGFVHEWVAEEHTAFAGWRHHQPEFDYKSTLLAAETCYALAAGARNEAKTQAHLRFSPKDEWMLLEARWTRLRGRGRPQALIDITPVSPNPAPMVRGCQICRDLVYRPTSALRGADFDKPAAEQNDQ